ncbi:hypothetical protein EYC84_003068 [Monilinia fructicola]|uniref:Prephenate dehydratase domain-containing protein n=1 Tax=Monilinia fructicola TaxID=38448 RepID=A0A5M9JSH4_MONFR|nr:hypothetical protein EYC84_003068 [Monilinia fructicola]
MSDAQANEAEKNIEIWKVKKLIKRLEAARGNGTSMISLIIPPKDQVSRAAKMLAEEYGTASNIKSRVNRQSVLSAITSTQQRLKLYNKVPPNGLVVYCGEILTSEGKERKVNIDFEPFKPINTSLYLCDNKFHTEALAELLESDQKFGFIIMDGNGALFGTLSGNTRDIVHKFSVDLPKKHGRGGQSALRFARLREEKRHNYVRKVAELAVQNFITADKVNVAGLILAGSADFKNDLNQSDLFDNRLATKVIKVVDVSYGGENGFNQAIELSAETLSNVKFIQEKKLIGKYFEEISQDTGRVCYGVEDTLKALELGAVEVLIVFENLEINRWVLKDSNGAQTILHTTKQSEAANREQFMDRETGQEMEVVSSESFLEWIAEKYRDFGTTLDWPKLMTMMTTMTIDSLMPSHWARSQLQSNRRAKFCHTALPSPVRHDGFLSWRKPYLRPYESLKTRRYPHVSHSKTNSSSTPAISFLGPVSSYTHQAALGCFDKEKYDYQPAISIPDVFEAVQSGQAELGVVPFENSTNGAVIFTLELLADRHSLYKDVTICGEAYLDTSVRQAKRPEIVKGDKTGTSAAIASSLAADIHGLDILAKGIEDREDNTTRFLILRKGVDTSATKPSHEKGKIAGALENLDKYTQDWRWFGSWEDKLSPGLPFVRRMWSGGSVVFNTKSGEQLCLNNIRAACVERIADVSIKGNEGDEKVFVNIERRVGLADTGDDPQMTSLVEMRNIVFMREKDTKTAKEDRSRPQKILRPTRKPDFDVRITPSQSLLFRFSALTFNAHAIHLDPQYCREVEGHKDLLLHGPLSLVFMISVLRSQTATWRNDKKIRLQKLGSTLRK